MLSSRFVNQSKPFLIILLLIPSFIWIGMFLRGSLGVNPIEILMDKLGEMALRLFVLIFILSALSEFKPFRSFQNIRRIVGVITFYYVFLHMLTYIFLDHFFDFSFIFKDIIKRPFITFGFFAFLLLIPLVFTSTNKIVKKLTFKIWKKIHNLIYIIIILALFHFYLLTKGNKIEPLIYIGIFLILFFLRFLKKSLIIKWLSNRT
jgi:sulfoxide reductase heme-binding subunit YedZ